MERRLAAGEGGTPPRGGRVTPGGGAAAALCRAVLAVPAARAVLAVPGTVGPWLSRCGTPRAPAWFCLLAVGSWGISAAWQELGLGESAGSVRRDPRASSPSRRVARVPPGEMGRAAPRVALLRSEPSLAHPDVGPAGATRPGGHRVVPGGSGSGAFGAGSWPPAVRGSDATRRDNDVLRFAGGELRRAAGRPSVGAGGWTGLGGCTRVGDSRPVREKMRLY